MKKWKYLLLASFTLIVLTGCISIPLGDGVSLKISKDGLTFTDPEEGEHSINFNEEDGEITFEGFGQEEGTSGKLSLNEDDNLITWEGTDGDQEYTATIGGSTEIPEEFPKDFPLAKDAVFLATTIMSDTISAMYFTEESMDSMQKMYEDYMNKHSVSGETMTNSMEMEMDGEKFLSTTYAAETNHGNVSVVLTEDIENKGVQVILSID